MAGYRVPGPLCVTRGEAIDGGTLCLTASPLPGPVDASVRDRSLFERAVQALEAEIASAGAHLSIDSAARQAYARQIKAMADDLRARAQVGAITWGEAATQANEARNVVMEIIRGRSTPVGRAMAQRLKSEGKTLNELIARKVEQMFGSEARFASLSQAQQNAVYAQIVESAGHSNPRVTLAMRRLSRAGRGLIVISLALSIYNVATSEDKVDAIEHEAAVTGAGIAGGIAGGALAGLACGPGAPVCVTVGAFVGGALAAFGVDLFW
jgi:hypothetical protein